MLDTETKRRIDSCRDILVGKVPDPKSQVEQITIALIYKFMDDMDAEAEELGGKRSFFAGEYTKYGWAKLMAPKLGGHDVLNLYSEAIGKMTENPGIPALFRDIFKNAYLPYRDPETLRSFLKEIDAFTYDHSERLGDAFEYLLSVLGSQGDAGQFRTPRHIIDFMVDVIAPQKHESILDPACGTAGFLISAWKHILKQNSSPRHQGEEPGVRVGDRLTPEQRQHLAANIHGYDISPDMVRLSLVNMYLHGFTDPHIVEYDTLTSEEKWNETADVILANPPFMSPKGGIKPHKRFSIQAKRSEVLFVDYMAEHLSSTGRAAIIVPEGIIFQSQTAYKKLRELLVKTALVALVSLPAGCFNPYSGVKTSILILDKSVARRSDTIAFFKVENDGYGLGAQRRAIDKNDLPQVKTELAEYLQALRSGNSVDELQPTCGLIVEKEKIAANGEYNLSGERYREGAAQSTHFPWRTVESLVDTITPPAKIPKTEFGIAGRFPIIDQSQDSIAGWTNDETVLVRPQKPLVIFGDHTCAIKLVESPFAQGADGIKILQTIDALDPRFLFHILCARPLETSGYQRHFSTLKRHQIPLPPLEVQKEIVAEIEGYQEVINGARAVLDNYRPRIPIHPDWPIVELGNVVSYSCGGTPSKANPSYWVGDIPWVSAKDMKSDVLLDSSTHVSEAAIKESATQIAPVGALLILVRGMGLANGVPICELAKPCAFNQDVKAMKPHPSVNTTFLRVMLKQQEPQFRKILETAAHGTLKINSSDLSAISFPLPSLATQKTIVAKIKAEQKLVAANQKLVVCFENKIRATLARVWGEDVRIANKPEDKPK